MREVHQLNSDWRFSANDVTGAKAYDYDDASFVRVSLPHTNVELPHHYFSENQYRFTSWYRRCFTAPIEWRGKRILLEFDGAMSVAEVYVNGRKVGEHKGGYVPFTFDITDTLQFADTGSWGGQNVLAVRLDSMHHPEIPPEGNIVDYMLFGGLYRNVRLYVLNEIHVDHVFIYTPEMNADTARVDCKVGIQHGKLQEGTVDIEVVVANTEGEEVAKNRACANLGGMENSETEVELTLSQPMYWDLRNPYLYQATIRLYHNGTMVDTITQRFGVRSVEFRSDGKFYLNGQQLKLRGLNRHQMFPYVGQAMSDRMQRKDADILKYELGLNFVRTSHYPQSPAFLERCDEIGLLVLEELPGWQHIGDESWKALAMEHLAKMIVRDRNHPAIFLWGVRINESQDDHDFYSITNYLAHKLDPTRPTGGIRNFETSEFLEDVYTVNDFENNLSGELRLPTQIPRLVTEYMGHMFPTQRKGSDTRLIAHAQKHASIQNVSYGLTELAGASGWCAFDYNTHASFGSGDRICYHGVMDIWRIPKYAAYFYQSQRDVQDGLTLFIARRLVPSMYEDGGDIIPIYSNCNQIEVFINDESIGKQFPDKVHFPNLPHPPFIFHHRLPWYGFEQAEIRAVGYNADQPVIERVLYLEGTPHHLELAADDLELVADGSDMTRLVVRSVDVHGQPLSLAHFAIALSIKGEGTLVGENPLVLEAGQAAVYIRTTDCPGSIVVEAAHPVMQPVRIQIVTS